MSHERGIAKWLTPYFGRRKMTEITVPLIRQYIVKRQEDGAANARINRELAWLKQMFSLAVDAGKTGWKHSPHGCPITTADVREFIAKRQPTHSTESDQAARRRRHWCAGSSQRRKESNRLVEAA